MLDDLDLFGNLLESIGKPEQPESKEQARACKTAARISARRAKSEEHLAQILPSKFDQDECWHVISHGDIDSLSYLAHALTTVPYFEHVCISTWCMARADLDRITEWLDTRLIEQLDLYVGEIFPSQYGDEFERAKELSEIYGCRLVVTRNHSKVMLMSHQESQTWLVSESSANVNTNPRIEQTAITASKDLFEFYKEFFDGLKTIDRRNR